MTMNVEYLTPYIYHFYRVFIEENLYHLVYLFLLLCIHLVSFHCPMKYVMFNIPAIEWNESFTIIYKDTENQDLLMFPHNFSIVKVYFTILCNVVLQ